MNIYERIFDRLEELHMSQIELSRRTGIATSTISDWRKKKINPQADKLVAICKALDMPLVDLLCDEDDKKNKVLTSECVTDDGLMIETMIISLGYRIKSVIATRFRQWATQRLKEYMQT